VVGVGLHAVVVVAVVAGLTFLGVESMVFGGRDYGFVVEGSMDVCFGIDGGGMVAVAKCWAWMTRGQVDPNTWE
jgi:hypothetical protein